MDNGWKHLLLGGVCSIFYFILFLHRGRLVDYHNYPRHCRELSWLSLYPQNSSTLLKIVDAEVMIGDEGFRQRGGASQVKARRLHQAVEKFIISSGGYVERKEKNKKTKVREG